MKVITFGWCVNSSLLRRVLAQHCRPKRSGPMGRSWLTLFAHAKDSLGSIDLFRCKSILLRSHWVLWVMAVFTRRIVGFGVAKENIDGISVCQMFNHATCDQPKPLRVLEIEELKSVPYAPISHPFVERLIATIRREFLDCTPVLEYH